MNTGIQTLSDSKAQTTTSVSPLDRESSSKNDVSSVRREVKLIRTDKRNIAGSKVARTQLETNNKLAMLKAFSRGKSAQQIRDVETLKKSTFVDSLKSLMHQTALRCYQMQNIYDLLIVLEGQMELSSWFVRKSTDEVIVYSRYNSIFPGIRFVYECDGYRCKGFNYDIRLKDK